MHIKLVAVGKGMPRWVDAGFQEYARRLPPPWGLELAEIRPAQRTKNSAIPKTVAAESRGLLAAAGRDSLLVALDEGGRRWTTKQLAERLGRWLEESREIALVIGGADGLDPDLIKRADEVWSLSSLTLPHMLVRVIVAEQLYRAWSIINHHPYHRA